MAGGNTFVVSLHTTITPITSASLRVSKPGGKIGHEVVKVK